MNQSKLASIIEILVSTALGFILAFIAQHLLFLYYELAVSHLTNAAIVVWMTVLSIARGYVVRRLWNGEWWKWFYKEHNNGIEYKAEGARRGTRDSKEAELRYYQSTTAAGSSPIGDEG